MAKKITNTDQTEGNAENKSTVIEKPSIVTDKEQIPNAILETLKAFSNYETLYVDSHGGGFTADTPKTIRGNATLYKNPFYEPK